MNTAVHRSPKINFGDLTSYLTYGCYYLGSLSPPSYGKNLFQLKNKHTDLKMRVFDLVGQFMVLLLLFCSQGVPPLTQYL
jgi:hypothetical protein